MAALSKLDQEELVRGLPKIGQWSRCASVLGQKVETHLIPDKGGVPNETAPGVGPRQLVWSNYTSDTEG
jgi:hypothetical protein